VRCESSLARLCFDVALARWYVHCFECGSERDVEHPCDYRWPRHLPVFLPPVSVAHWRRAIEPERRRTARPAGAVERRARPESG
jgi:hypothetical protein